MRHFTKTHLCGTHLHGSKAVEKTAARMCKKHTCGGHVP